MKRTLGQARFAAEVGVSKQAIGKAVRSELSAAFDGKGIDLDHPATIAYRKRHQVNQTEPTPSTKKRTNKAPMVSREGRGERILGELTQPDFEQLQEHLREFLALANVDSLQQVRDALTAIKTNEEITEKRLRNAEATGKLISRDLVSRFIIAFIDSTNRKLLADAPKRISTQAVNAAKAGQTAEEIETMTRATIGSYLEPIKQHAVKQLRDA